MLTTQPWPFIVPALPKHIESGPPPQYDAMPVETTEPIRVMVLRSMISISLPMLPVWVPEAMR